VVGLLIMTRSGTSGAGTLVVGFLVSCIGTGPLVALGTNLVIGSVPPERAGSAAAVAQTGNEFGYALGIAVLGSVMTAVYRTRVAGALPAGAPDAARDTLAGATQAAHQLPDQAGGAVLAAAHGAFVDGLHTVAALSAVVLAGVAVLLLITLRHIPALGEDQPQTDPASQTDQRLPDPIPTGFM
jgi:DHA2 family multidrug resistance protein-like MFS transporter